MSAALSALQAQVAQNTSVEQSAVTLIQGLAAHLQAAIDAAANGDTAALPALQIQLAASAVSLAQAVTLNTPASPLTNTTPAPGSTAVPVTPATSGAAAPASAPPDAAAATAPDSPAPNAPTP